MSPSPAFSTAPDPAVYVVATDFDATDAAVQRGDLIRTERGAGLVILVPDVAEPGESMEERVQRRRLRLAAGACHAATVSPPGDVRLAVGVSVDDAIERAAPRRATVVVAGPARFWWPSRAQRLVEQLRRLGYDSVFVSTSMPSRLARFMWQRVMAAHGREIFPPTVPKVRAAPIHGDHWPR